jgi:O-antigen ligase/polysaccharide polymerase Wzy-like membrane protein
MPLMSVKNEQAVLARDAAVGIGVAAAVFALSYADGGFAPTTRSYAGIAAWWLLGAGAAIGIAGARAGINRLALAAVGLLAAFAIWILISVNWATDAERTFWQFNQVSLYVAVLAIAIVLARLVPVSWAVGGVALALSAIATVALVSRCFPSTFGLQPGRSILPALASRLSFPLGYWNGLGIEVALAYPLLIAIMTSRRSRVASTLAALPLPILAAVMYLTSSRGAFVAAGVSVIVYVALTPRRWGALTALVVAGVAGAVSVAALVHKTALVNGAMDTPLGVHQGHRAALVVGVTCIVTALVWLGLAELGRRLPTPPRVVGVAIVIAVVGLALVAIVVSHPVAKFEQFKSTTVAGSHSTQTTNHLLASSGSGRWQFWGASISEFRAHPLNGGGAGSWEAWWLQHGSLPLPSEFAHSLYLEALAELGIVGLLLIGGAVVVAVVGAIRSALALQSGEIAAAAACGIAFFVAAAYDWVWQLAGIAVVGVGMLGFALGALPAERASAWGRFGALRPALALVAVAAIIPQYVVLAAGSHLENSHAAFRARDGAKARSEALAAKAIEPWAASPYLQLGFVAKAEGRYAEAARWGREAIQHSRRDWNVWANAAIFEAKNGNVRAALRDFAEARRLNPHSSILAAPGGGG